MIISVNGKTNEEGKGEFCSVTNQASSNQLREHVGVRKKEEKQCWCISIQLACGFNDHILHSVFLACP